MANADGSDEVRITDTCCPRWSWDGTRILGAALDGQRITTQVLNRDGSFVGKVPLPPGTLNLGPGTWAPDGKRICFDGFGATSDEGLYVGSVEGGGLVRLTHKRGQTVDFTPDGKRVVYFEAVPGFESGGNPDEPNGSLFVINADGSGKANQVTPKAMQIGNLGGYIARISRDGDWLVFAAEEAIWKIHVDGTGLTKVYQRDDGRIILSPTWSPDGQYIMFGLDPPGTFSVNNPPNSLVVIRADGSGLSEVITSPDFKVGPDWTP
jgi:Tol biopolymer transport system component